MDWLITDWSEKHGLEGQLYLCVMLGKLLNFSEPILSIETIIVVAPFLPPYSDNSINQHF